MGLVRGVETRSEVEESFCDPPGSPLLACGVGLASDVALRGTRGGSASPDVRWGIPVRPS